MTLLRKTNFKTVLLKKQNLTIKLFSSDSHAHDSHNKQHNEPHKGHNDDKHNEHHKGDNPNEHHNSEHHDDHHGHHEITGKVDFKRIYVPLNEEVIFYYSFRIINF